MLRHFAYDRRLFKTHRLPACVVSVGNIAVCGTGKTPLVRLLASMLSKEISVAILTRGFRSELEHSGRRERIPLEARSAAYYGDEPLWLSRKTGVAVWVGKDRVKSGALAISEGAQVLLLDDGMQHRRLERDIEIVVVDGCDPFAGGVLRDSPSRLRCATLIVAVGVQDYTKLYKQLSSFSTAPLVGMQKRALTTLPPHQRVGVFCGIGRPERFVQTVRDLNQEIVDTLFCKDHTLPSLEELHLFARGCREKGATALLCTEKDGVKLDATLELPVVPVEIGLEIVAGEEHWEQLIETILKKGTS